MKAWIINQNRILQNVNVPIKEIGLNEVLVKIKACGINNRDKEIRIGNYSRIIEPPIILGGDISGTVEKIGSKVKKLRINDNVMLYPIFGCDNCEPCKSNKVNYCKRYQSLTGGFAEYIVVPESCVIKIPEYFSYEEAAALPIAYLTAWNMLFHKAQLNLNETILIWGATGGVGIAGIQFALQHTKNVIAISRNKTKLKKLLDLGVPYVINISVDDVFETVMNITNREGVDIIFDPVGEIAWESSFELLKQGGRYINCGRNTGSQIQINLQQVFSKQLSILGAKTGTKKDLEDILSFLQKYKLKPIIDKVFSFSNADKAMTYFEDGDHFGKVIINNSTFAE